VTLLCEDIWPGTDGLILCKIIVDRPRRLKVDVYSERFTSQSKHGPGFGPCFDCEVNLSE
jgi:hypothetical protein